MEFRHGVIGILAAVLIFAMGIVPAVAAEGAGSIASSADCVPGEAIVCVKTGGLEAQNADDLLGGATTLMDLSSSASQDGLTTAEAGGSESLVLVHSDTLDTDSLIAGLSARSDVAFAEPNTIFSLSTTPDYTGLQWAYNPASAFGTQIAGWNSYNAAGEPTPTVDTSGVVVAVLDSGIDYTHEDLKGVMWNEGTAYPALTALGGGAYGCNTVGKTAAGAAYDSKDPMDDNNHGTHCAGVIAAQWNGIGVSGAASGTKLMAVKAANDLGNISMASVIKSYNYIKTAVASGVNVKVINNSWETPLMGNAINRAVTEAGRQGVVSVFASGNRSLDCDTQSQKVSTFADNPYAVVVDAADQSGSLAGFSNYGEKTTDLAAPGVDIYSTVITGRGKADPEAASPEDILDSFERAEVNPAGAALTYGVTKDEAGKDSGTLAMAVGGGYAAGTNALEVTDTTGQCSLTVTGDLSAYREKKGLAFLLKSTAGDPKAVASMIVKVKTTDGEMDIPLYGAVTLNSWTVQSLTLPDNTDYKDFKMEISLVMLDAGGKEQPGLVSCIDTLTLASSSYAYMSGTSMAAPAVSGEAAILAARFKGEPADKIAARVKGSVTDVSALTDKCVSGGIANVAKALSGDTMPVLDSAGLSGDDALTVKGYFFGDTKGSVTIDGVSVTPASWSDTAVTVTLPAGFAAGEKKIVVTTSAGKSGRQSFEIGSPANLYSRIPLPEANAATEAFFGSSGISLTGLGGDLYYLARDYDYSVELFRYDPDQAENAGWTFLGANDDWSFNGISACTWNGNLVALISDNAAKTSRFALYDPAAGSWRTVTIDAVKNIGSPAIVNSGGTLYLIGGYRFENFRLAPISDIYTLDLNAGTATKVGNLNTPRIEPAAAYTADGRIYVTGGRDTDQTILDGLECVTPGEDGVTVTTVKDKVLPQDLVAVQEKTLSFSTVDGGMMLTGPIRADAGGKIIADTYELRFEGDAGFEPTGKLISTSKVFNQVSTAYRGRYYVLGQTAYSAGHWVFATDAAATLEQPGDITPATDTARQTLQDSVDTGIDGADPWPLAAVLIALGVGLVINRARKPGK